MGKASVKPKYRGGYRAEVLSTWERRRLVLNGFDLHGEDMLRIGSYFSEQLGFSVRHDRLFEWFAAA